MLEEILMYAINGFSIAMALFLSAAGLTVLFGILRILNFAHGSFIVLGAYIASSLVAQQSVSPSTFILFALLAGVATAALGLIVNIVIFRRLRHVQEANALIATFALMLLVEGTVKLVWGADFVSVSMPAGLEGAYFFGSLFIPEYSIFIVVAGVLVFAALEVVTSRLWVGKVIAAVAKDPWIMGVLGYDTKKFVAAAIVISFFLAGFAGTIIAPSRSLYPTLGHDLVIQAFAVVVVGGLGSVRGAFLAAILLGMVESFGAAYMPSLALYLAIIVVLLLKPEGLIARNVQPTIRSSIWARFRTHDVVGPRTRTVVHPAHKAASQRSSRPVAAMSRHVPLGTGVICLGVTAVLLVAGSLGGGVIYTVSLCLIAVVFALSWNLMFGYAGLAVFGHAAFFAVGAYLTAYALTSHTQWPLLAVLAACAVLAVLIALVIGGIALVRAGGLQLAILTLALGEVFRTLVSYSGEMGRDEGISGIVRPTLYLGFADISLSSDISYYWFLCVMCGSLVALLWVLSHSALGRTLRCIHQDHERAAFVGINVDGYRLLTFVVASSVAAVCGGLFAPLTQIVTPEAASITRSTAPMLESLLGGTGSFWGPAVGAVAFAGVQYLTRTLAGLSDLVIGVTLLSVILVFPSGIVGMFAGRIGSARRKRRTAMPVEGAA